MNVRLLRKVQKHILEEPKRFNMGFYCHEASGPDGPPCGTVGCIGGWAHLLNLKRPPKKLWTAGSGFEKGKKALKLTEAQAFRLFRNPTWSWYSQDTLEIIDDAWPRKFGLPYLRAETPKEMAEIASRRIDHFIATKGKE